MFEKQQGFIGKVESFEKPVPRQLEMPWWNDVVNSTLALKKELQASDRELRRQAYLRFRFKFKNNGR